MKYYVVVKGIKTGIFETWEECELNVKGVKNAQFKKFSSLEDAKIYYDNHIPKVSKNIRFEEFEKELSHLFNIYSIDNYLNIPDFELATKITSLLRYDKNFIDYLKQR